MLILNLTDVQYLQKAVFGFEKNSDRQNHASSGSLHVVKKSPPPLPKIADSPPPLLPPQPLLFGKPCKVY